MAVNEIHGPIDIAISGMRAHDKSISVITDNIANFQTTDTGNGQPYSRVEALFTADEKGGVLVDEVVRKKNDFKTILDPSHPHADKDGYVRMPNINLPTEMINLSTATRAYQANTAVLKRYQQIVENSLELLR